MQKSDDMGPRQEDEGKKTRRWTRSLRLLGWLLPLIYGAIEVAHTIVTWPIGA